MAWRSKDDPSDPVWTLTPFEPIGGGHIRERLYTAANPAPILSLIEENKRTKAALELIKEEAAKNNAPYGRSDSLAIDRIRIVLAALEPNCDPR